eukprot:5078264-Pyramimonas_sp.AAC.1
MFLWFLILIAIKDFAGSDKFIPPCVETSLGTQRPSTERACRYHSTACIYGAPTAAADFQPWSVLLDAASHVPWLWMSASINDGLG